MASAAHPSASSGSGSSSSCSSAAAPRAEHVLNEDDEDEETTNESSPSPDRAAFLAESDSSGSEGTVQCAMEDGEGLQEASGAHCVARRTRSQVKEAPSRVSYAPFFENSAADSVDEDDSTSEEDDEEKEDDSESEDKESYDDDDEFVIKRVLGINVMVPRSKSVKERPVSCGRSGGVAYRTRSRFASKPETKKRQLGTLSSPYCLDDDDDDSDNASEESDSDSETSSSSEEMQTKRGKRCHDSGENVEMDVDERGKGKAQEGPESVKRKRSPTKKTQGKRALKGDKLYKLILDTILNNEKDLPSELVTPMNEAHESAPDNDFPLIFEFMPEEPKEVVKTKEEQFIDELWADFEFAQQAANMGSYSLPNETEDDNEVQMEVDPSSGCSRGQHKFVLDEQIGIMCRSCSYVSVEIKYVLPPFETCTGERPGKKNFTHEVDSSALNNLFAEGEYKGKQGFCDIRRGTVWELTPGNYEDLYEHQREAFEFMWKNLAGSINLDKLKSESLPQDVGGCVISHAPGTGKTRLAIIFIQTYIAMFPECRPVIIAPRGMLITWEKEFKKWNVNIPFHCLNSREYNGKEDKTVLKLFEKEPRTTTLMRMVKLYSWTKGNSILGISYGMYKNLTVESSVKEKQVSRILIEKPGLFIFDEGHTPRNERSLIWKALEKVKTGQRIILSGTPFQNNFRELYNTLCLVRPKFAAKIPEKTAKLFRKKEAHLSRNAQGDSREKNELKENWANLTTRITDERLEELKTIIKPFVHVYNGKILDCLPGLRDCVVFLEPLPHQKNIIEKFEGIKSNGHLESEYKISMASIHPSLLTCCGLTEKEESIIDKQLLENMRYDPSEGVKTRFIMELVRMCEALKEKVLVFCQHIEPMSLIRDQLVKVFNWTEGMVLQMDGKIALKHRQSAIDIFNDPSSEARVLLASTKACCEGINLTGASRVVLLDVVWNPSVERQAVSRAYRIGQKKMVYTYHLISGKTEGEKYEKMNEKERLSKLVFSQEKGIGSVKISSPESEEQFSKLISEDRILQEMTEHDKIKKMFLKIYYQQKEQSKQT